jgi:sulfatase maturation enzyme AslB (radical SAM superfamily)
MFKIFYRGKLDSCNYTCSYCPFSKNKISKSNLMEDEVALKNFLSWVCSRSESMHVMITPWGEAAVYDYYQRALIELSQRNHVKTAAIQTNLSGSIAWVGEADLSRLALWVTWHPDQIPFDKFHAKARQLLDLGVRYSVGVVALPEFVESAKKLREMLPKQIYVWMNAAKEQCINYGPNLLAEIGNVDPLFRLNLNNYPSKNLPCSAGRSSLLIDATGNVQRCHLVNESLGNIYQMDLQDILRVDDTCCPNEVCDCYLGHINFKKALFEDKFGDNVIWRGSPEI